MKGGLIKTEYEDEEGLGARCLYMEEGLLYMVIVCNHMITIKVVESAFFL